MEGKEKFEAVLINNPEYMGNLNEEISALVKKMNMESVTSQSLWKHFYQSVQRYISQTYYGVTPTQELWAISNGDNKAVAFAHWYVMDVPYNGTVFCDFIYSWNTSKIPAGMLIDKFIDFGKKHGCVWYMATAINERVFNVFRKAAEKRKMKIIKHDSINFIGRK
jgi:hypothetical protein